MDEQPHVMLSIGEIAERDGISKQAVSKAVSRLVEDHDIPVTRDSRGRIQTVGLAHWDQHREQYTNPAKKPADVPAPGDSTSSYNEARRRNEWLKYDRAQIEYQEEAGQLVRADRVADALEKIGVAIQRRVNRLQNRADDLALAVSQEGAHGLRLKLRQVAFEINEDIADLLAEIGGEAPARDPAIEEGSDA